MSRLYAGQGGPDSLLEGVNGLTICGKIFRLTKDSSFILEER